MKIIDRIILTIIAISLLTIAIKMQFPTATADYAQPVKIVAIERAGGARWDPLP